MLTDSDMFGIHDRLHFCKDMVRTEFRIRVNYNEINGSNRYRIENNDMLDFYESATLFLDAILAHKVGYMLGPSFNAKQTFGLIIRGANRDEGERLGLIDEHKFGEYSEEQLRFILKCNNERLEEFGEGHLCLHYQATNFILNCILETGKYPLTEQLRILMDDYYCERLQEEGISSWRD